MIKLKVTGIKSGWRSVFMVLTTAAADPFEPVVDLAFENAEHGEDAPPETREFPVALPSMSGERQHR